jgi:hypothetical protein
MSIVLIYRSCKQYILEKGLDNSRKFISGFAK